MASQSRVSIRKPEFPKALRSNFPSMCSTLFAGICMVRFIFPFNPVIVSNLYQSALLNGVARLLAHLLLLSRRVVQISCCPCEEIDWIPKCKIDIAIAADDCTFPKTQMAELYSSGPGSFNKAQEYLSIDVLQYPVGRACFGKKNKACSNSSPTQVAFQNHE